MSKIVLKKPEDMPLFRRAASVHTQCFVMIEKMLQEQQWTLRAIDEAVHEFIRAQGCSASFYGYSKYPAALCMSVNDEVVHTIPDDRIVGSGDIVSVDLGVQYKHCMVDSGKTIYVWNHERMDADTRRLLTGNYEALLAGLRACKTAKTIGDISAAIGAVARKYDLGIVRELCGHGTGYSVHEEPFVENDGRAGTGPKIVQGMMLAIEPIFTLGKPDIMELDDGWNIVTCDGSLASQYEHNVYFSAQGPVIVTHWGVPEWYKS